MGKPTRVRLARFHRSEINEMQELVLGKKTALFDQSFCQKLAEKFNLNSGRAGRKLIQWKQVERWLHNQQKNQDFESKTSSCDPKEHIFVPENSSYSPKELGEKAFDISDLEFEVKSSTDGAWYDVSTFLQHRILSPGQAEVRVRFRGFGPEEDEWVNIRKAVRERSVPVESSECRNVEVGDTVLCFRENGNDAAYFDARVVEIERRLHDVRGCRCLFSVQYDHDKSKETVHLSKMCRRPSAY